MPSPIQVAHGDPIRADEVPSSRRRYRVGPTTVEKPGRLDPLSSWSIVAFAALTILWFVFRTLPEPAPRWFRAYSRLSAYGAAGLMLVPYLHILRRGFRYRYWGRTATWMRWHILAAYLGFGLAIIHSRARSNNELTFAIQVALWAVIVSGVIGFYGQKLVYRLMSLIVDDELGLERLGPEREQLIERAVKLAATLPVLEAEDVPRLAGSAGPAWSPVRGLEHSAHSSGRYQTVAAGTARRRVSQIRGRLCGTPSILSSGRWLRRRGPTQKKRKIRSSTRSIA